MTLAPRCVVVVLFALALFMLAERESRACTPPPPEEPVGEDDPCTSQTLRWSRVVIHNGPTIVPDGVIVVSGEHAWSDPELSLELLHVEVQDAEGRALPGTLELGVWEGLDTELFLWFADQPFALDQELLVVAAVDNALADDEIECAPDRVSVEHSLHTVPGAGSVPAPKIEVTVGSEFFKPSFSSVDGICCDGGMLEERVDCLVSEISFSTGYCTSTVGRKTIQASVQVRLDVPGGEGPFLGTVFWAENPYTLGIGSRDWPLFERNALYPTDHIHARIIDLRDGTLYESAPTGLVVEPVDENGLSVNPDLEGDLADHCRGTAYRCAWGGPPDTWDAWDPDACTPWGADESSATSTAGDDPDDGSSETGGEPIGDEPVTGGCTCQSTEQSTATIALVPLMMAMLRRRRRTANGARSVAWRQAPLRGWTLRLGPGQRSRRYRTSLWHRAKDSSSRYVAELWIDRAGRTQPWPAKHLHHARRETLAHK